MRIESPAKAKELHARLVRRGLERYHYEASQVLISYSSSHNLLYKARLLFDQLHPRTFNSNVMIRAYSQSDHHPNESIHIYSQMRKQSLILNDSTFVSLVKACTRFHHTLHGQEAHLTSIKLGFSSYLYVSNAFIHMYVSFRDLRSARRVFDEMCQRDLFSWKNMICGYSGVNQYEEVLSLFKEMQVEGEVKGDSDTLGKVVLACKYLNDKKFADNVVVKYIRENNVDISVYLGNTLIDFYRRYGLVGSARNVFDHMPERNLVSWNSMIMLYAEVGNLVDARGIFDRMPVKDVISWNTMITGYSRAKRYSDALYLFEDMMAGKVKPDGKMISSVLSCCGHLRKLDYGVDVHKYICSNNIEADIILGNALINMYFKCRSNQKALKVFEEMEKRNAASWTAVVVGFALNGYAKEALKFYSDMLRQGLRPTDTTFTGVLVACAHAGLVDEGLNYFESMKNVHKIEPNKQHYGCVVNLLSKYGLLDKAYEFIQSIPGDPDAVVWRTLLSGCKVHGNVVLAEIAFKKLLEMDPSNRTNYVVLFNTSAGADRLADSMTMTEPLNKNDLPKASECGSTEVDDLDCIQR